MTLHAPAQLTRRRALIAVPGALWVAACASPAPSRSMAPTAPVDLSARSREGQDHCHPEKLFTEANILLLGELHDHAGLHARRLELLRRAVAQAGDRCWSWNSSTVNANPTLNEHDVNSPAIASI